MGITNSKKIDLKHIDVLDGIRALSVIIVLLFHFWQQTWIFPTIKTPFLHFIKLDQIDFTNIARAGYLLVDMMVLLSGFLLFLPVMRQIFLNESMDSWKVYAKKRIARIIPSYYFCVLILFFVFAIPDGSYESKQFAIRDLLAHLTFTQTLTPQTYFYTPLNTVLWTVAIEVWFYILFPIFAEAIKKRPNTSEKKAVIISAVSVIILYLAFNGIASWWEKSELMKPPLNIPGKINQLPAFMGAYANGMLGAMLFVLIAKHCERTAGLAAVSTLLSIVSLIYIVNMINECATLQNGDSQIWQVTERFRLTAAYTVFILATALSARWYRFIFSNPLMRFLSGISYNLYIWHQWTAVDIKYAWRIPYWEGIQPPNEYGDRIWMTRYAIIITIVAFAVAIITTYCVEKPFARLIMGKPVFQSKRKQKTTAPKDGSK